MNLLFMLPHMPMGFAITGTIITIMWLVGGTALGAGAIAINNATDDPTTINNNYYGVEPPKQESWLQSLLPDIKLPPWLSLVPVGILGFFTWKWWKDRKPKEK